MPRLIRHAVLVAALALSLSACGRRGALEPPPGGADLFAPLTGGPDRYAAPRSLADLPGENAAGVVVAPPQPADSEEPPPASRPAPPKRTFLLDPLL